MFRLVLIFFVRLHSLVVSECNSVYCLNGGTCRDEPNGYSCDCRLGFNGKHCEGKFYRARKISHV